MCIVIMRGLRGCGGIRRSGGPGHGRVSALDTPTAAGDGSACLTDSTPPVRIRKQVGNVLPDDFLQDRRMHSDLLMGSVSGAAALDIDGTHEANLARARTGRIEQNGRPPARSGPRGANRHRGARGPRLGAGALTSSFPGVGTPYSSQRRDVLPGSGAPRRGDAEFEAFVAVAEELHSGAPIRTFRSAGTPGRRSTTWTGSRRTAKGSTCRGSPAIPQSWTCRGCGSGRPSCTRGGSRWS
jgi:hypothetical protein